MINKIKKKLIVIGAGYAGITLVDKLKNNSFLEIILINKNSYHLHQTDIHRFISGKVNFEEVAFDLNVYSLKSQIKFIKSNVQNIDFNKKEVCIEKEEKLKYDYLVIATGSKSFFPKQINNIEEYAQDIKEIDVLKNKREEFLELIKSKKQNKNIAIVGGGLSGVEIALEFAEVLKERNIKSDECSISIIEQLPQILPNLDSFLVDNTTKRCDELNIKRVHDFFVSKVANNKIYLSNEEEINFDMVLFLIGVSSEKLVEDEKVLTNVKNQFIVDDYLRLIDNQDVFVLGDIAQTKDKDGNYVLPTAQMAKMHGDLTAKNISNLLENKQLIKNELSTKGVMIDLASNKALGIIQGLKVKSYLAYFLKRFVSKNHTKIFK